MSVLVHTLTGVWGGVQYMHLPSKPYACVWRADMFSSCKLTFLESVPKVGKGTTPGGCVGSW